MRTCTILDIRPVMWHSKPYACVLYATKEGLWRYRYYKGERAFVRAKDVNGRVDWGNRKLPDWLG